MTEINFCPKCDSPAIIKKGKTFNSYKTFYRIRYKCKECQFIFRGKRNSIKKEIEDNFEYNSKPKHTQNWPAYDNAKKVEKLMFMDIMNELSLIIRQEKNHFGRPQADLHEMIFSMAMKTFTKLSSRRVISDLQIAKDKGLIDHVPHYSTLMKYYADQRITPLLKKLIELSSLPLKEIEESFSVDATGFSSSLFGRWMDHRFGRETERRQYLKLHAMIGNKSNIIISAEVTPGNRSDHSQFQPLVETANKNFNLKEVCADKGYLSQKNLQIVSDFGGTPFIPFKKNTKTRMIKKNFIWAKMFYLFKNHKQYFLGRYHLRSNIESSFMAVKLKFGSHLMTRNFEAQQNEILTKVLCYNISVLIQEYFEERIEKLFSTGVTVSTRNSVIV